jgi:hypothetical protein
MAKATGLGQTTLSVDDSGGTPVVIKNDVTSWNLATPREEINTTGVDKSAKERLLGLADCSMELTGVFNAAVSHLVFRTVPSTSVARTSTLTVNAVTLAPELLFTDYALERGDDGALTWTAPGALSDGTVPTWA